MTTMEKVSSSLIIHNQQVLMSKAGTVIYIASVVHEIEQVDPSQTLFDDEQDASKMADQANWTDD